MPQISAQARRAHNFLSHLGCALALLLWVNVPTLRAQSAADYPSLQAALDANPGQPIYVPPGNYELTQRLIINRDGSGLYGPGHIIQKNAATSIVTVENAAGVELRGLTLTRAAGAEETRQQGLVLSRCRDCVVEDVRVLENHSPAGSIELQQCEGSELRGRLVQNYMCLSIDDRTHAPEYGYAFRCIDGTGIVVDHCQGTLLQNCRVLERHWLPTPQVKEQYGLGKFTAKNPKKGTLMSQAVWDAEYVNNWHQGSGIIIDGPTDNDGTRLLGNYIENGAQGMDIHADHVIIANNIVKNCFMGMKAMHGSRHVIITGNQFIKNDLWSIGLMPGTASFYAQAAEGGKPARGPNRDGGSIIAHNIISEFGQGHAAWIWAPESAAPIRFDHGPFDNSPPLHDVLIQGNIVYDTGTDAAPATPPRYSYTVRIEGGPTTPQGLHFQGNLFHPGLKGISNTELPP